MTAPVTSSIGRVLYDLLPTLYRARDNNGDLAYYLDACGSLLDAVRALLDQRLADGFIESCEADPDVESCQPWLVPYIAQLLDVRLASPLVAAQRAEIANSVAWRQQKGTLGCALQIAREVGGVEVKIQEGWRRVATTPHVALPLVPHPGFEQLDKQTPLAIARHPNLPAVTVDFREGPHRAPIYPGGSEDQSKRTVDQRTPSSRVGHFHPKRLLLYGIPRGFFSSDQDEIRWEGLEAMPPELKLSYEDISGTSQTKAGRWTVRSGTGKRIRVEGRVSLEQGPNDIFRFEDVYFAHTLIIKTGTLELERVAAFKVEVHANAIDEPALWARNSLVGEIQVASGLSRLEYCTVLRRTLSEQLQASDCIFLGALQKDHDPEKGPPETGCIRYSRIPADENLDDLVDNETCPKAQPVFYSPDLGQPGGGALHPATPDSIRFGAEDDGEMGAYHHLAHCLNSEALSEKLGDFLALGLEAVVIPDVRERYWRPYAFESNLSRVDLSGTHNGWGRQPMALVDDHTWQATATFGSGPTESFRFEIAGDESVSQGNTDTLSDDLDDSFCSPYALCSWVMGTSVPDPDIPIDQGAGSYLITFNDESKAYKVTKQ